MAKSRDGTVMNPRKSPRKAKDFLKPGRHYPGKTERILDQAFAEYGDKNRDAVYMPRIIAEFEQIVRTAMVAGEDTVTMPTSLCMLVATYCTWPEK